MKVLGVLNGKLSPPDVERWFICEYTQAGGWRGSISTMTQILYEKCGINNVLFGNVHNKTVTFGQFKQP